MDKTANMGENMKHKYGSKMNINMNRGKYDKFKDDPESEDESSGASNRF